jgi:hypothetical protein
MGDEDRVCVWYLIRRRRKRKDPIRVPAYFVHATPKRVAIEVLLRDGHTRQRIHVSDKNIIPREAGEGITWTR